MGGGTAGFSVKAVKQGSNGLDGTQYHPKCIGGHSGAFCDPCVVGTYKYGYSYGRCLPCQSKPDNAYYTATGVSSVDCPYECQSGMDPMLINPDCLD